MVDFSDRHDNYHICKEDTLVHHSKHHPNIENRKSAKAYKDYRKTKSSGTFTTSESPPKKLCNSKSKPKHQRVQREINEFVTKNHIYRATELYASAQVRRKEGQAGLAAFVLSCAKKISQ